MFILKKKPQKQKPLQSGGVFPTDKERSILVQFRIIIQTCFNQNDSRSKTGTLSRVFQTQNFHGKKVIKKIINPTGDCHMEKKRKQKGTIT